MLIYIISFVLLVTFTIIVHSSTESGAPWHLAPLPPAGSPQWRRWNFFALSKRSPGAGLRSATNQLTSCTRAGTSGKTSRRLSNQLSISKGEVIVVTERSGALVVGHKRETQVSGYSPRPPVVPHAVAPRARRHARPRLLRKRHDGQFSVDAPEGFMEDDEIRDEDLVIHKTEGAGSGTATAAETRRANSISNSQAVGAVPASLRDHQTPKR